MISHFYLQRAETRTLRQSAPSISYVMAKGVGEEALRKYQDLGTDELTTGQLESAFASTVTLWGVVLRKKARDRDRKQE
jgi:hypothetical protein